MLMWCFAYSLPFCNLKSVTLQNQSLSLCKGSRRSAEFEFSSILPCASTKKSCRTWSGNVNSFMSCSKISVPKVICDEVGSRVTRTILCWPGVNLKFRDKRPLDAALHNSLKGLYIRGQAVLARLLLYAARDCRAAGGFLLKTALHRKTPQPCIHVKEESILYRKADFWRRQRVRRGIPISNLHGPTDVSLALRMSLKFRECSRPTGKGKVFALPAYKFGLTSWWPRARITR